MKKKNIKISKFLFVVSSIAMVPSMSMGNDRNETLPSEYVRNTNLYINYTQDSFEYFNLDEISLYVKQRLEHEHPQLLEVGLLDIYIRNLYLSYEEGGGYLHYHEDEESEDHDPGTLNSLAVKDKFYNELVSAMLRFHNKTND